MKARVRTFLRDESGVTAVEYAVIIGTVVLASFLVLKYLGYRMQEALVAYLVYEYAW